MKDEDFKKIFSYLDKMEVRLRRDITNDIEDRFNERFNRIEGALEANLKYTDDKVSDVEALGAQVDRHERYFDTISGILEVDLDKASA
ncbi:MAG: hypothetical protein LBG75_02900 [Candidatus Nomurabacteria bacterium]|jgi:hypothetical protein|nr:hypothetical protein [Candidatus Nomurabacteria bacterium]